MTSLRLPFYPLSSNFVFLQLDHPSIISKGDRFIISGSVLASVQPGTALSLSPVVVPARHMERSAGFVRVRGGGTSGTVVGWSIILGKGGVFRGIGSSFCPLSAIGSTSLS